MAIQVITMVVGCCFVYHAYLQVKKGIFRKSDFALWAGLWGGLVALGFASAVFFPLTTTIIGTYRAIDFVIVFAVIVLFWLQYWSYSRTKVLQIKFKRALKKMAFEEIE